jgi:glycosyltransferase involved in cell wall biosynthesis
LQHRATPWFPELSARGTWDGRESYHRWFLQRATRIITGTKVGRDQLAQFYQIPPENILILPHPTPRFVASVAGKQTDILEKFGLKEGFVLYPAQFWPHKNHANLILALDSLAKQGRKFCLVLTGTDKGNRSHIEALTGRLGLRDAVRFLGFVEQSDLVALYRKAAVLAYVSWCGPENLPPLEAFANECPVVATRIPGSEEQLGDAAELCDPARPDDIARAILAVVDNDALRARLIAAGTRRAEQFTPLDYVAGAMKFFDEFEAVRRCWP